MPTTGSTGISKSSHSSRPIYLSISVSIVDSRFRSDDFPTGATTAPIPVPIACKVRQVLRRLRQTFFHAQLNSVNLALIPGLKHFLEACGCLHKTIHLRSPCLQMRCVRAPQFAAPWRAGQAYRRQTGSEGSPLRAILRMPSASQPRGQPGRRRSASVRGWVKRKSRARFLKSCPAR